MADHDCPTTTDRNLPPDAESLRYVQGTELGIKRSFPEYQAGDLETLRSLRKVLRGAVTRLLKAATELRQAPAPSPSDLLEAINELVRKDTELNELNQNIGEILEGDEFELDYSDALLYQERICRTVSRLRSTLKDLKAPGMRRHSTSGESLTVSPSNCSDRRAQDRVPLTATCHTRERSSSLRENEKAIETNTPKLVAGNGEDFASTVELKESQMTSVELNVGQAPDEACIEPPSCGFEYIFVPDFMKGESLPKLPEALPARIVEVGHEIVSMRDAESFNLPDVRKPEQPFLKTSAPRDETAIPGQETAEAGELTRITKPKSSESDTTGTQTRRRHKTNQRKSFTSEHKNYHKASNPSSVPRDCFRYQLTTEAGRAVWFRRITRWRRMALLKWQRRLKHRWKRKR